MDGDGELLLADGEGGRLAALHRQRRQRRAEAAAEAEEGSAVGSGRGGGRVGSGRGGGSEAVRVCIGWWSSRITLTNFDNLILVCEISDSVIC